MAETISAPEKKSQFRICVLLPFRSHLSYLKYFARNNSPIDLIVLYNLSEKDYVNNILQNTDYQNIFPVQTNSSSELKTGILYAQNSGYDYVITLPTEITDIKNVINETLQKLSTKENQLLTGNFLCINENKDTKTLFSTFIFWATTGYWIINPWSSFCAYPLQTINIKLLSAIYTEAFLKMRLAWNGLTINSITVQTTFSVQKWTVKENSKTIINNILSIILFIPSVIWYRPVLYLKNKNLKRLFFNPDETIQQKAYSISFGIFMGIIPIWGFQILTAMALSFVFKLNKPLVLLFTNISFPPFIPFIVYMSMLFGKFWFSNSSLPPLNRNLNFETIKPYIEQYVAGSITLAIIAAILAGGISSLFFYVLKKRSNAKL
jgi:uncharacterized protein (DUF2062 family)